MSLKDNYYAAREKRRVELEKLAQASKEAILDEESAAVGGIRFLSPDVLDKYCNDPFREYTDQRLDQLVDSIRDHGILSSIVVRPKGDGRYEILSGRNRVNAAKILGLEAIPCIIKEADDDEAALIVTETNLNQRDNLRPSEKAFAYKMQLEALKNQGKKHTYLTDFSDVNQENQDLCHSDTNSDARRTVHRYIRLTELENCLLELVDRGKLPMVAAEQVSYLTRVEQLSVNQYFYVEKKATLDVKAARLLRERAREENLNYMAIKALFEKEKKSPKSTTVSLKMTKLRKYVPDGLTKKNEIEQYILEALAYYGRCRQSSQQMRQKRSDECGESHKGHGDEQPERGGAGAGQVWGAVPAISAPEQPREGKPFAGPGELLGEPGDNQRAIGGNIHHADRPNEEHQHGTGGLLRADGMAEPDRYGGGRAGDDGAEPNDSVPGGTDLSENGIEQHNNALACADSLPGSPNRSGGFFAKNGVESKSNYAVVDETDAPTLEVLLARSYLHDPNEPPVLARRSVREEAEREFTLD